MSEPQRFIPVYRPWIDEREAEAARRPILSGWVTMGPEVEAFEKEFAAYTGAHHACAVSSCTTALHLGLLAVGVGPGSEVITVSHTFIATANSVRFCLATPVFVDIQPDTFNMDPDLIEQAITPRTKAILCVHQIGMPCDMKAILAVAKRHSLPVVEDAACGIGSEILCNGEWDKIGKPHGDVCCFSFHPRKLLTTGDGGMITTSNAAWDERFRRLRHHGMNVTTTVRHQARRVIFESYPETAFNYRMTDIQAAVGREQLKRLPDLIRQRRLMAERYRGKLEGIPGLKAPREPAWARSNWQSYCVRLSEDLDQQQVMQQLLDKGVATRRGIMCIHREQAYADLPCRWPLRESESAQEHCVLLPLYHQMTERDQDYVVEQLAKVVAMAPAR
ncbi:MAG TPA: DegT/DnrJ/EryC1/StrS family aminotransferase [Candidatus Paceibacterota bacterium]|nr:DegT/DnrJ/EryC1/StrS family aminotransferase [Verrucomicrobiota bacterium]HSA10056.1 DegT/DnrJ/EryC1/StrS family aminotransferase [Candidatus Paceibacterota bacterium]